MHVEVHASNSAAAKGYYPRELGNFYWSNTSSSGGGGGLSTLLNFSDEAITEAAEEPRREQRYNGGSPAGARAISATFQLCVYVCVCVFIKV